MKKHKTSTLLLQLLEIIEQNLEDFKSFKEIGIVIRNNLFFEVIGKIQEYKKGISSMNWTKNPIVKNDYQFFDYFGYLDKLSKKYPIINELISCIEINHKFPKGDSQIKLVEFLKHVLFEEKHPLSSERIIELITLFNNDLISHPPDWTVKLYVTGIWTEEKEIIINDNLLIRKPVDSDYHILVEAFPLSTAFSGEPDFCDSIFELNFNSIEQNELQNEINKTILSLQYFNLGNTQIIRSDFKPNSIVKKEYSYNYQNVGVKKWKYELNKTLKTNLTSFLEYFTPLIPPPKWEQSVNSKNAVYTAMARYKEALFNFQIIESKITNAITALEALFLKVTERSELSHKLSQRISFLLSKYGFEALKAYRTLHRAYEIRSTYIHGALMKTDEKKDFNKIEYEIMEYCRLSIIIFLELTEKYEKDNILSKIDNSILDKKANEQLDNTLQGLKLMKLTVHNITYKK